MICTGGKGMDNTASSDFYRRERVEDETSSVIYEVVGGGREGHFWW